MDSPVFSFRSQIHQYIAEHGEVSITFTKADGTERTIIAIPIPDEEIIAIQDRRGYDTESPKVARDPKYTVVWSKLDEGFRTINIDTLVKVEPV